jgi:hypothetical protein
MCTAQRFVVGFGLSPSRASMQISCLIHDRDSCEHPTNEGCYDANEAPAA